MSAAPKPGVSRDREPLTIERATALAEIARRDGRIEDAQRLDKIARELANGAPSTVTTSR